MTSDHSPPQGAVVPSVGEAHPAQPAAAHTSRFAAGIAAAIILLIFLTPAVGFWWLRSMARDALERNALSHTRDMLIRYTARTRGQWPASWNDLSPDLAPADAGYGTPDIDALRHLVEVDFDFNPQSVTAGAPDGSPPPRIVWLRDHPDSDAVRETNTRLVTHLRKRFR